MSSKSSGSPYEVMERLGEYRPKVVLFRKGEIDYSFSSSDNTANVPGNSLVIEKDYDEITTITYTTPKTKPRNSIDWP